MAMIVVSGVSRAFGTTRRSKAWPVKYCTHDFLYTVQYVLLTKLQYMRVMAFS